MDLTYSFAKKIFDIFGKKLDEEIFLPDLKKMMLTENKKSDFLAFFCNM